MRLQIPLVALCLAANSWGQGATLSITESTALQKPLAPRTLPGLEKRIQGKSEFAVTGATEVLLNGRPCQFKQIPSSASIIRMEVDADGKTILRIHFRSGR